MNEVVEQHGMFVVRTRTAEQHREGLGHLRMGDFDGAISHYRRAIDIAQEEYPETELLSRQIHEGRLHRDIGLACLKLAAREVRDGGDATDLQLSVAQSVQESLWSFEKPAAGAEQHSGWGGEAFVYVHDEIGASYTARGRAQQLAAVSRRATGLIVYRAGYKSLIYAHSELRHRGSNTYYRTSNALHLARGDALFGHRDGAKYWRKFARGMIRAAWQDDRRNLPAVIKTYFGRRSATTSPKAARKSILRNP